MRRALSGFLGAALGAFAAGPAFAAGTTLDAISMTGQKLRIDGDLREWPGRMDSLSHTLQGNASGGSAAGQIGYDDKYLYVAFKVTDKKLARTSGYGAAEDHGTVLLAIPTGKGGYASYELSLFQGEPGKVAGSVRTKNGAVGGAQLVEAPSKNGFTFEAKIPWSALPQASTVRVGMRAALRYTDADSPGSVRSVVGTATGGSGASLPRLRLENEQGLAASLLKPKGLPEAPARELYGDLNGDRLLERVAVYGGFLTIVGPKYRGGNEFYFGELGVSDASMVTRLELRDFDGDKKDEILVAKRIGASDKYREVVQVLKIGSDDAPWLAFSHEIAIVTEKGKIENELKIVSKGSLPAIQISQGPSEGFEPDTYAEPLSGDMPGALLPWESVKSRTFQWDGKAFSKIDEASWKPSVKALGKKPGKPEGPPPPPPPRPPTADEMLDRLYALYRKERKVGARAPRFDFVTDVAGGSETERVLVHDRDVVVFGKGYRGGTTYSFITIGVADPKDVLDVTARDLTGDGKAEIVVRGVLHAKASKELGGDVVDRYALFVYQVTDAGVRRIFAAETGRALKDDRIVGTVAFVPERNGAVRIELRPGRAIGWTEKSYPFPPDTTAAGGLEPLLLPWGGGSSKKYAFDGSAFAAR